LIDTADAATETSMPNSSASGDYTPTSASATAIPGSTSGDITPTVALSSASATASGNGSSSGEGSPSGNGTSPPQNGTQTPILLPDSQNATGVLTLTLTGTPTAYVTSLPNYTGLAARFNSGTQMRIALGVVGAGFAMFL